MPRIAMINTVCSGSHGRIMGDLRRMAARDGHETRIFFGRGPAADDTTVRIDTQREVLLHVADTRLLDRHALASRAATRRLVAQLDTWQPDLIHLHNAHGYYLHAPLLFDHLRARGIPTLWTHHDCWAVTGHCSHFTRVDCQRWRDGCYRCPQKHEYPASWGLDASRSNWAWKRETFATAPSLRLVAPSAWLADDVLAGSFLRDVPRDTIPNGVDLDLFVPGVGNADAIRGQYGLRPGQALLLAVASPFDERKGFADALAVANRLGDRARLVLVGLTEKQIGSLPPGVTGVARTDGPEALISLYGAADCLINPTKEDTYPTVTMEAMACGTPVAGYRVGGLTEQLEAPCGLAVSLGDTAALADAALTLAAQRAALRGACRDYACTHFDRRVAMDRYRMLYASMTGVLI